MLIKTDCEVIEDLGHRVRRYRLQKRISQKTLAAKAGVHVNTLRALERNGEVKLASLAAVLRALGERAALEGILASGPPHDLYGEAVQKTTLPQRVRERRT